MREDCNNPGLRGVSYLIVFIAVDCCESMPVISLYGLVMKMSDGGRLLSLIPAKSGFLVSGSPSLNLWQGEKFPATVVGADYHSISLDRQRFGLLSPLFPLRDKKTPQLRGSYVTGCN